MPLAKLGKRHQVTIPKALVDKFKLKPGDYVEVTEKGKTIIIVPKEVVDRDDAWFWSEEWQAKEREADVAITRGDVVGPFDSAEDLIKDLKS